MGKVTGFLEIDRQAPKYKPAGDRIRNFKEFVIPLSERGLRDQAARCMDCGIPFCHDAAGEGGQKGCPVNNQIPDWNDLVYNDEWEEASRNLHSTNNFPEFTGPHLPGAVRGVLHAEHHGVAGHDQVDRVRDRRQGVGEWLDRAPDSVHPHGQVGRGGRHRSGGHGGGPAARPGGPRCPRLRQVAAARRADGLRHSRLQDGEAPHRAARLADGGRGGNLPLQHPCRHRC